MKTLTKIFNYLRSFDLFGVEPALYFKGQKKAGTSLGFCLTFLLLIFTSLCFGFFGTDLYYRTNPQLRYNEEYNPFPAGITIDPEISPILIELNDVSISTFWTNSSIINMNVSQFTMKQTDDGLVITQEDYKMEICTKEHFSKLDDTTRNYFQSMVLDHFFCIPKDLKNLTMLGSFDQYIFQTIKFTISICNNITNDGKCLSTEAIKETMNSGYIGIYFVDNNVLPSDYANPKQTQPKEVFTNFMIDSQKEIDI